MFAGLTDEICHALNKKKFVVMLRDGRLFRIYSEHQIAVVDADWPVYYAKVFAETFCWLCEKEAVNWTDEKEESEMLKRGGVLAKSFDKEFGEMSAEPLVSMRVPMVDKETGALVQSNDSPVSVQCSLDLISNDGVILKLKTSSRSMSKLEYEWALDLQCYVYEQTKRQVPTGVKVVNLVRTKKPKMQVIDRGRTAKRCHRVQNPAFHERWLFANPSWRVRSHALALPSTLTLSTQTQKSPLSPPFFKGG